MKTTLTIQNLNIEGNTIEKIEVTQEMTAEELSTVVKSYEGLITNLITKFTPCKECTTRLEDNARLDKLITGG